MAATAAIFSDHLLLTPFFFELQGMMGIAAYPRGVSCLRLSLCALGARRWIPFTRSLKEREREKNLYLMRWVIKHLFGVCLLKMLLGEKF